MVWSTVEVCHVRLAISNKSVRRQRLIMTGKLVQDDQYGVSTPTFVPTGGDDELVDDAGMVYFPEEFSGCNDNGDSDDFRNDEVVFLLATSAGGRVLTPCCPVAQRIDCVHEARRGWYDKGAHVLDSDGLSVDDLAPTEVKHRIMTYCMVRFQEEESKTQECYEALVDALTGTPEPVHIRLRWDDPMPHPAEDYEDEDDLPVAGKPARMGGGGASVGSIIAAYVEGMCANSDGFAQGSVLCGD